MNDDLRAEYPAIAVSRDRFVDTLRTSDSLAGSLQRYENVIDKLIEWTIPHLAVLHHTAAEYHSPPKSRTQMKVQFCLRDTDRVFWAAYPSDDKKLRIGAKLIVLQDDVAEFEPGLRDRVRSRLEGLDGFEQIADGILPTVGFNVLFFPKNLNQVQEIIDDAVGSVRRWTFDENNRPSVTE